ncbi:uncharacterized protein LOC113331050 [Papaver somniferum]|uniref:uncharacterized protein LOC113331050 n=1 Tax=Papaver somniferum TaxID=3469 RepID=UPI000E6FF3D2|nr:uncharacterized protein LOC113331050 [Papaver somniferum]
MVVFVFIAEPWVVFDSIPNNFWSSLDLKLVVTNDRGNQLSNLWCLCARNINVTVVSNSMQLIACEATMGDISYFVAGIYASTSYLTRRDLWIELSNLMDNLQGSWCLIGDFSAVLGAHEKSSGPPPIKASCDDFLAFADTNDLHHLDTRGAPFTWTNGHKGKQLRLDSVMCNEQWLLSWDSSVCSTLARVKSDHHPLLFKAHKGDNSFASSFKFQSLSVNNATHILEVIQQRIADEGYSDELHIEELDPSSKLIDALKIQKDFWRDKSRLHWVKDGDACTRFFHTYAKIRAATNKLTHLKADGNLLVSHVDVSNHVASYFQDMYAGDSVNPSTDFISRNIQSSVTQDENNSITSMPNASEIKAAVDDMNANGAPGPDGFSGVFFTSFWDIVGADVINYVQSFFLNGWHIPNANPSHVTIIHKEPGADTIEKFRPIALGNFHFKIIGKILANRLSPIAFRIISPAKKLS